MSELDFQETVAAMLSRREPIPQSEYEAHIFKTEIRATMERWGFESRFQAEIKEWTNKKQEATLRKVEGLMVGKGAVVALVGIRGTGKTTISAQFSLLHAWGNYREGIREENGQDRRIVAATYRKATDLIARYKSIYSDSGSIDTERLMESRTFYCREIEFATIDELHECEDQKMKNRVLADILDRRYAARRDTLLISNQTPEEFQQTTSDSILSRLSEHGEIIPCNWPSFRTK